MEQVAPAYEMPEGFVSVTDYGAVPNDGQDDTMALRDALAVAKIGEPACGSRQGASTLAINCWIWIQRSSAVRECGIRP
ncbi:hypothetical protein RE628_06115 [Paenibacillus sp. D2_2]|uniref:hypothetical protein n=1 Tax=Paenibacillus sp. D2_2 TaxID=3073092 RepID=UPI00281618AD|nr:hypothetical protein [Paenibacillus sp. D2_2]WMT42011.1 hypothetical protein RE628_06115 [Paenibacillus sp. D2_2]